MLSTGVRLEVSLQHTNGCKLGFKSSVKLGLWNDVPGSKKHVGLASFGCLCVL